MTIKALSFAVTVLLLLGPVQAGACTVFSLTPEKESVTGFNMDWIKGDGILCVNKRGVSKTSIVMNSEKPAKWISKYGSVTLNLGGSREFAIIGMNEKGMVVCGLLLTGTRYPAPDSREALWGPQWQQYHLDNYSTVEEAIEKGANVRIWRNDIGIHYYIQDKSGRSAVIEFIDGKRTVYTDASLPVCALENNPYAESSDLASLPYLEKWVSRDRALFASCEAQKYSTEKNASLINYSFNILQQVADKGMLETYWSVVFDSKKKRLYFRTRTSKDIKWIDMSSLDFRCGTPVKILELNAQVSGNIKDSLKNYDQHLNKKRIEAFFADAPKKTRELRISYPGKTFCIKQ